MPLLLLALGAWLSVALHEFAHLVAFRVVGGTVLAAGTGWPPIRVRWRVGRTMLYVGATAPLSGLTIPGDEPLPRTRSVLVSAAGPVANLAFAWALVAWPTEAFPVVRYVLAGWNLFLFLDNALPGHRRTGGNDGAHVEDRVANRAHRVPIVTMVAYAGLYDALGLRARARETHEWLALSLAYQGLPVAAGGHVAALRADVEDDPAWAEPLALLGGWIAYAEGRHADAEAALRPLQACEPAWRGASARMGLAMVHAEAGELDAAYVPEGPDDERASLLAIVDFGQGCRADDAARARRGAAVLGTLLWTAETRLAQLHLRRGDIGAALPLVLAAAAGARVALASLPPDYRPEASTLLEPLRAAATGVAAATGDADLPDRLLAPAKPDTAGQLLYIAAYATCAVSVYVGAMLAAHQGTAWWVLRPAGAPVLALLGLVHIGRHGSIDGPRLEPGARVASGITLATVLAAWGIAASFALA